MSISCFVNVKLKWNREHHRHSCTYGYYSLVIYSPLSNIAKRTLPPYAMVTVTAIGIIKFSFKFPDRPGITNSLNEIYCARTYFLFFLFGLCKNSTCQIHRQKPTRTDFINTIVFCFTSSLQSPRLQKEPKTRATRANFRSLRAVHFC